MRARRAWLPVMVAGALLASAGPAPGADQKRACVEASTQGQSLRDAAKLLEAREQFVVCARDECPAIVRKYCVEWLADMDRRVPTVVFRALSASGDDLPGARLTIDGAPQATGFGSAISLDPGEHLVHAQQGAGGDGVDEHVVVVEGEKGRTVTLRFAAPPPATDETPVAAPATRPTTVPAAAWVFGGVGVAGLAAFTALGLVAKGNLDHLRQTCAPYCASSELDSAKHLALAADVSLGLGIVALGVAAYTLLSHHETPPAASLLELQPSTSGALLVLHRGF